jgi:pimeloyl-ACP methyl ester carboxylesterase
VEAENRSVEVDGDSLVYRRFGNARTDVPPLLMDTENSHLLAQHLPNAQLRIDSDSGHGFLDQYPTLFADHVTAFLNDG